MPSPQMQRVIDALWQRQALRAGQPARTLEQARAGYAPAGQLLPLPDDVSVATADADGVPAYWLDAPGAASSKILFFIHGGGYTLGSLRSHGPLAARLSQQCRRRVLFVDYRLAPENPFPAAVEDVLRAFRWLARQGIDLASAVVAGDSAGGGLALTLLQVLRDRGHVMPAGAVLISPWVDLACSGTSMISRAAQDPLFSQARLQSLAAEYLNGASPRDPAASPLLGSQAGLPPLLIQVGGAEVLLSDSERLAQAAAEAGVRVILDVAEGLPHVYQGALGTAETAAAIRRMAEFMANLEHAEP